MTGTKIQWHPGFVAAMDLELFEDREKKKEECYYLESKKGYEVFTKILKKIRLLLRDFQNLREDTTNFFRQYHGLCESGLILPNSA